MSWPPANPTTSSAPIPDVHGPRQVDKTTLATPMNEYRTEPFACAYSGGSVTVRARSDLGRWPGAAGGRRLSPPPAQVAQDPWRRHDHGAYCEGFRLRGRCGPGGFEPIGPAVRGQPVSVSGCSRQGDYLRGGLIWLLILATPAPVLINTPLSIPESGRHSGTCGAGATCARQASGCRSGLLRPSNR
jgi:hypothetical protein